ncbi:MAG: hypothetical protein KA371_12120 [Acidobacteria bacterium]|nr:hypothetical protein [Acidobacteriota bacterium]
MQIGLDFGTAYMKAVCRDVVKDSAWVYVPRIDGLDPPCLSESAVALTGGTLSRTTGQRLPSVKMALRACALEQWDEPVLVPFRLALGTKNLGYLPAFVETCATYSVAETLAGIRASVVARLEGFGERHDDYMAVNMAIPVADAQLPHVNAAFLRVLKAGWRLSVRLPAGGDMDAAKVLPFVDAARADSAGDGSCFVYPEVSANVQGFVRSRVSRPDIYLFCDVGAGTVDQSVFIYHRNGNGADTLVYLDAAVLPLGSSEIETRAAAVSGKGAAAVIDELRRKKELGKSDPQLDRVKKALGGELAVHTKRTLLRAKKKLYRRDQLDRTRVIFGGGGHTENPYSRGTLAAFKSEIFANSLVPDTLGMPQPTDLELPSAGQGWMRRLSVAYGLSFERHELVPFTYPSDVDAPKAEDVWRPHRRRGHAPTKDEV